MASRSKRTNKKTQRALRCGRVNVSRAKPRTKKAAKRATSTPKRPGTILKRRTCFVIMPFGKKDTIAATNKKLGTKQQANVIEASELWEPIGLTVDGKRHVEIDFDEVYDRVIKPALASIREYEIDVIRCDEINYSGWIHERMIEQIAHADIAIVDLTTLNPNVFYELGIRHALKRSLTVLTQLSGVDERIPFNLGGMSVVKYSGKNLDAARDNIQQTVTESLVRYEHVDSLVFKTLPNLRIHEGTEGIEVVPLMEAHHLWEGFVETYYAWNPSWQTELVTKPTEWLNIHVQRANNKLLKRLVYIIGEGAHRTENKWRYFYLRGFRSFLTKLLKAHPSLKGPLKQKMEIYVVKDLPSDLTFFVGKKKGLDQEVGLMLFNERPFLVHGTPTYALVTHNQEVTKDLLKLCNGIMAACECKSINDILRHA